MSSKGWVSSMKPRSSWSGSVGDDGFSIEAFIEKDFVWGKLPETRVSKNEAIVNVSNMFDK